MASFTTSNASNNSSNNSVGRELKIIASSFVKQYYTLLNKAPCYIYNFYSNNSTFIHGTIEMANEHYTEPIVGREKIKRKMEDLKLNDCRAKIKQIDCLETLAGGLVIQVIGELSDNGRPMRRFLQTFVLAPSPDEPRTDGDPQGNRNGPTDRRGAHQNENNASSPDQKFFVLNSIFRYQDDGPEGDFENDTAEIHAEAAPEVNSADKARKEPLAPKVAHEKPNLDNSEKSRKELVPRAVHDELPVDNSEKGKKELAPKPASDESQADGLDKGKKEAASKPASDESQVDSSTASGSSAAPISTVPRVQPSSEPKTWANMVRNHPPTSSSSSSTIQVNTSKPLVSEHPQNSNPLPAQAHQQQPPQISMQNNGNNGNNLGNNRRRHMMRKPANKTTGRSIKNRPPRPPVQPHQQQPPHQGKPAV